MNQDALTHAEEDSAYKFISSVLRVVWQKIDTWPIAYKTLASNYLQSVIEDDLLLKKIFAEPLTNNILLSNKTEIDINSLWLYVRPDERINLGQFFTPKIIVEHILDICNQASPNLFRGQGLIADIACGSGVFLQSLMNRLLIQQGMNIRPSKIISRIVGIDKDPRACALSKLSIALELCNFIFIHDCIDRVCESWEEWPRPRVYCTDTLDYAPHLLESHTKEHIFDTDDFRSGLDAIISNFPFLEAKRMNRTDPNLKSWLKTRFPILYGAFDLYVPFLYQALKLLKTEGIMGVVLPNKFLIARYAKKIRETILNKHQLIQITDCSRVREAFYQTDVYPIILFLRKNAKANEIEPKAISVESLIELPTAKPYPLYVEMFKMTGDNYTFFCQNPQWYTLIRGLFLSKDSLKLKKILDIRSTISFHKKGLRERFVKPTNEFGHDAYPYLGGLSYSHKNEIDMFKVNWNGYYIYYPPNMKSIVGHNVAPISIFRRPKIIFCQHSQRLRAFFDFEGKFLTKDVYPIAFPKDSFDNIDFGWLMAAYLNSSLLTVVYNTIFHGITIAEGFYHYLPVYLKEIPIILPNKVDRRDIIQMTKKLQGLMTESNNDMKSKIREIYENLDLRISIAHNISEKDHYELVNHIKSKKIPFPW